MALQARSLVILTFLVAAAIFYATGFFTGLTVLIVMGAIFELLFWAKLLRKRR